MLVLGVAYAVHMTIVAVHEADASRRALRMIRPEWPEIASMATAWTSYGWLTAVAYAGVAANILPFFVNVEPWAWIALAYLTGQHR